MDRQTEEIKAMAKAIFETGEAIEGIDLIYASLHGADSDGETKFMRIARHLYCNDYRKASDVAKEIFKEIEAELCSEMEKADDETIVFNYDSIVNRVLAKLKKKHESKGVDNE